MKSYPFQLWLCLFTASVLLAGQIGYVSTVFNLPEDYIVCWIESLQNGTTYSINGTDICYYAKEISAQLSLSALNYRQLPVIPHKIHQNAV